MALWRPSSSCLSLSTALLSPSIALRCCSSTMPDPPRSAPTPPSPPPSLQPSRRSSRGCALARSRAPDALARSPRPAPLPSHRAAPPRKQPETLGPNSRRKIRRPVSRGAPTWRLPVRTSRDVRSLRARHSHRKPTVHSALLSRSCLPRPPPKL
eukprot:6207651-Pleurochrysis_carterae.AAC.7